MYLKPLLVFWLVLLTSGVHAATPTVVAVPTAAISSSPGPLRAFVFRPDGAGSHPAVVMVHGCGGAYGKDGQLNARHAMWADYLSAQGFVALMLDSFSSRGIKEICTTRYRDRTLKEGDRVGDAHAALAYLRQLPGVDADRIALLGWSHGGGVVLDAIGNRQHATALAAPDLKFRAAIAFYPGCTSRNKQSDHFHPYAPLLLLIGEADDWTPAAPCKDLVSTVAARSEPMHLVAYPDTFHDFDNPALTRQRVRKDVPNGVNPGVGVTTAPNVQAREDAKQRVKTFLDEHLK